MVLDGVIRRRTPGGLAFHPARPPSDEAVAEVLRGCVVSLTGRQPDPQDPPKDSGQRPWHCPPAGDPCWASC